MQSAAFSCVSEKSAAVGDSNCGVANVSDGLAADEGVVFETSKGACCIRVRSRDWVCSTRPSAKPVAAMPTVLTAQS